MLPFTLYLNQHSELFFSHLNRLDSIDEYHTTETRTATAWIASHNIRFAHLVMPTLAHSLRTQAAAFEMEEQLLVDVNDLHFALCEDKTTQDNRQNLTHLACVPKDDLQQLLATTKQRNIRVSAVYPDIFLLPWDESETQSVRVFIGADRILVRTARFAGFAGDMSLASLVVHHISQLGLDADVELFVEHGVAVPEPLAHYATQTMSLHQLMSLAVPPAMNLLQGEFEPISPLLLWLKASAPTIKPLLLIVALLGLSTSLGYAKRYIDTQSLQISLLRQVQQNIPEAGSNWRSYLTNYLNYYKTTQQNTLPWRQFQSLLPILQSCDQCKVVSLVVEESAVVVTLLSTQKQDAFARQSIGKVRIETLTNKGGNYNYRLSWKAQ